MKINYIIISKISICDYRKKFNIINKCLLCLSTARLRLFYIVYNPATIILGSSIAAFILRKNSTASRPSTSLWSYVRAMYIIGLMTTYMSRRKNT